MSSAESALLPVKVHDGTSSSASSSSPRQIAAEERRDRSDSLLSLGDDAPPPPHHHREGEGEGMGEDEDEDEEPGKMRVSELKAELDLRGVDYSGCFDKESLAAKLLQARATGKANPDIIDDFNKMRVRSCLERGWNLTLTFSFWLRIGFLHHSYLKVCFPFGLM
mmetsp:Transcript_29890/g.88835  ORF Transcript_29890/g.88835 Transcript_29890/m.88835 type:complete len:165 (-) Transcript_29890:482-976(-)